MNECEMKQDGQMAIEARIKLWETVLDELDKVSINKDYVCFDNFYYAKIYCKKKSISCVVLLKNGFIQTK